MSLESHVSDVNDCLRRLGVDIKRMIFEKEHAPNSICGHPELSGGYKQSFVDLFSAYRKLSATIGELNYKLNDANEAFTQKHNPSKG